ncbi:CHASE domain-containing protein [Motiliproteus sp. MSK22-1]|uniref:CHASE domain-containing hybrid sensor histidine kinase/response regulator n=1 Tax=Motiliproteus sp. MSK22-1 TaxID=1897630 RepID=UPI000977BD5F|nr:CHASE domain-containing protein [Motiliproteus sp. MSK22-1]OMH26256.1 hypothetical protein BGP75_01095 [Motiliproteus sp. MSK22-1]
MVNSKNIIPDPEKLPNSVSGPFFATSTLSSPTLILLLGLILSLLSFWQLYQAETTLLQRKLDTLAAERTKLLDYRFDLVLRELKLLSSNSKIVGDWDQAKFEQVTETLVANDPAVYAFEWIPVVPASKRALFEQSVKAAGSPAFYIAEPNTEGQLVPAADRSGYMPVLYYWPKERNAFAHGLDHGFWDDRRQAMELARNSNRPAITPRVPWIRDAQVNWALLAFIPIFRANAAIETVEQRMTALTGYALAALDPQKLLERASEVQTPSPIDYTLYDTSESNQFLAIYGSRLRKETLSPDNDLLTEPSEGLYSIQSFGSAGRQYSLLASPLPQFEADNRTAWPWIVAIFGLILTILMVALLRNHRRHNNDLARAVRERTQEVEESARTLREKELFNRLLLENLAEGVVACDAQGQLKLFNRAAREWHGTDPSQTPPEDWAQYYDLFEEDGTTPLATERIPLVRAWQGETVTDAAMSIIAKGQPPRTLVANGGPLLDENGNKQGAIVTMYDVTKQREAQLIAEQMQNRFRDLFEFAPDAMIMVDHQGVIRLLNRRCQQLFGWLSEELVGQKIEILIPQENHKQHIKQRENFLNTPLTRPMGVSGASLNAVRKDGTSFPVEISLGPMETEEGPMVAAAVRDITDRLQQEKDRQELLLAQQATVAKSAFLATMSHEIRTPMNGVIGCVDLLARSSLKPHQAELVETMHDSAFTLLRVIDDILDFSKIEAGQLELEHQPVSLERIVESVCATMKQVALRKGLKLDIFTDPNLPGQILSDSVRLRQILNNLLSNAIKFSSGQGHRGRILVRAELKAESQVSLSVADNGIGITAEAQSRLFKPFAQAEASTTRRYGGTGLGLSICKRLVEMLGGEIGVISEPGQGSTFTITLPIERTATPCLPPNEMDLTGLSCLVILQARSQAKDWCIYLQHAHATTDILPTRELAEQKLSALPAAATVVLLEAQDSSVLDWYNKLTIDPKPSLVIVGRGQRLAPRQLQPGIVMLDSDAVTRGALLQAIAIVTGRAEQKADEKTNEHLTAMLTPPDRDSAMKQGRLVLVAEDNHTNQKMIRCQLALLGYAADFADNGQDALDMWHQNCHSLLLTDLQMPKMDGYELAQAIRSAENGSSGRRPIIAITANALKEEAERCREAGMDDYLSKPLILDKLKTKLAEWLPEKPVDDTGTSPAETDQPEDISNQTVVDTQTVLDTQVLKQLIGDEPELVKEFLLDFRHSAEEAITQIRRAISTDNWEAAGAAAHRLKSSSRAMGAMILGEYCERIENAQQPDDDRLLKEFDSALMAVFSAIDKICGPA